MVFSPAGTGISAGGGSGGKLQGFTKRITINVADTEQSEVLAGAKFFAVKNVEQGHVLRIAYNTGDTTSDYITLYPKRNYCRDGISADSVTLYLRSAQVGHQIEIEYWT